MKEKVIWEGHPHHTINLPVYIICGLFCWLFVPLLYAFYVWYENRSINYELTTERLLISTGIFSRKTEELELYRVKDLSIEEPFFMRLLNLANIKLTTSDKTLPEVVIIGVEDARELKDEIRKHVELLRDKKGVREIDGI